MYRSTVHTFSCPCGQEFKDTTYEYVNVAQEPRLRYVVLAGLLNVATCPICGRKAALARPFIYSDPQHDLLAYVHPQSDAPEEARQLILERLSSVYLRIAGQNEDEEASQEDEDVGAKKEIPPLKVVFGLEQLVELINAELEPDERLGRLAMSTQSRDAAERAQFFVIARKLASDMDCGVEVEDLPDEYTVWLYGPRLRIGVLMRNLSPQ
jgi:hypothetical protein